MMANKLPNLTLRRTTLTNSQPCACRPTPHQVRKPQPIISQIRHASLLRRPHRPYTFTQLVTLSDGSTYLARTTSPAAVYKATKDSRNHPMWQPSLSSLRNVEEDEAGRLKAFRQKFGRGWDADTIGKDQGGGEEGKVEEGSVEGESYIDLISGYMENEDPAMRGEGGKKK